MGSYWRSNAPLIVFKSARAAGEPAPTAAAGPRRCAPSLRPHGDPWKVRHGSGSAPCRVERERRTGVPADCEPHSVGGPYACAESRRQPSRSPAWQCMRRLCRTPTPSRSSCDRGQTTGLRPHDARGRAPARTARIKWRPRDVVAQLTASPALPRLHRTMSADPGEAATDQSVLGL